MRARPSPAIVAELLRAVPDLDVYAVDCVQDIAHDLEHEAVRVEVQLTNRRVLAFDGTAEFVFRRHVDLQVRLGGGM